MKLDRNKIGRGKYAIVKLRKLDEVQQVARDEVDCALALLLAAGVLTYGEVGTPDEFFVVMLKDRHAQTALYGYGMSADVHDREYAKEVRELAHRAGPSSPYCKDPD